MRHKSLDPLRCYLEIVLNTPLGDTSLITGALWVENFALANMWEPSPLGDQTAGAPAVVACGPQSGPMTVGWVREQGLESLLIFCRKEGVAEARYIANVVSGALPQLGVAVHPSPTGMLPTLVLASDALRFDLAPAVVLAVVKKATREVLSGLWLKSVSRLKEPNPSLGQFLRSLLPGPGFVVVETPESGVHSAKWNPEIDARPGSVLLVGCDNSDDLPTPLVEAFAGLQAYSLPKSIALKAAFGADGAEFVVRAPQLPRPNQPTQTCGVCRQPVFEDICPFCQAVPHFEGVPA